MKASVIGAFAGVLGLLVAACAPPTGASVAHAEVVDFERSPTVQALKANFPDDYAAMKARLAALPRTADATAQRAVIDESFGRVIGRERAHASPEIAAALYDLARMEEKALRAIDTAACAAFLDGRPVGDALTRVMTPALAAQEASVTSRFLQQVRADPRPRAAPLSEDMLVKLSIEAVSTLPERDQDLVIPVLQEARAPRTTEEARVSCDFSLALADVFLAGPPAEAGALVRGLWASD